MRCGGSDAEVGSGYHLSLSKEDPPEGKEAIGEIPGKYSSPFQENEAQKKLCAWGYSGEEDLDPGGHSGLTCLLSANNVLGARSENVGVREDLHPSTAPRAGASREGTIYDRAHTLRYVGASQEIDAGGPNVSHDEFASVTTNNLPRTPGTILTGHFRHASWGRPITTQKQNPWLT